MALFKWKGFDRAGLRQSIFKLNRKVAAQLPNRCLMCHQLVDWPRRGLCDCCLEASLYHTPTCLGCGHLLAQQTRYCGGCTARQPLLTIAACNYHHGLGEHIAAIKYHAQLAALSGLTLALSDRLKQLESSGVIELPQVLIPVPLHPNRLRQRGFNQAWLIANEVSRRLNIPIVTQALSRITDTHPQMGLSGKQRRVNLDKAFHLTDNFGHQRIAIIDDVVTTGTTVKEIANLFEARYISTQVWCLARAGAPDDD